MKSGHEEKSLQRKRFQDLEGLLKCTSFCLQDFENFKLSFHHQSERLKTFFHVLFGSAAARGRDFVSTMIGVGGYGPVCGPKFGDCCVLQNFNGAISGLTALSVPKIFAAKSWPNFINLKISQEVLEQVPKHFHRI